MNYEVPQILAGKGEIPITLLLNHFPDSHQKTQLKTPNFKTSEKFGLHLKNEERV